MRPIVVVRRTQLFLTADIQTEGAEVGWTKKACPRSLCFAVAYTKQTEQKSEHVSGTQPSECASQAPLPSGGGVAKTGPP